MKPLKMKRMARLLGMVLLAGCATAPALPDSAAVVLKRYVEAQYKAQVEVRSVEKSLFTGALADGRLLALQIAVDEVWCVVTTPGLRMQATLNQFAPSTLYRKNWLIYRAGEAWGTLELRPQTEIQVNCTNWADESTP